MWKTRSNSALRPEVAQRLEQLAALLEAGTPLPTAASALARTETHPQLAQRLGQLAGRLEQGAPLGEALTPLGLGMLPEGAEPVVALRHLARYLRRRAELRRAWRRALAYPTFVLAAVAALWLALPPIAALMQRLLWAGTASTMPAATRLLLDLARLPLLPLLLALLVAAWLLPGMLRLLLRATPLVAGILRRLTAAELLDATALRLRFGSGPGEAVQRAYEDTAWATLPAAARPPVGEAEGLARHLRALSALRRFLAAWGAGRASIETPTTLEAGLRRWLRPLEALPLFVAEAQGEAPSALARNAERAADDLHDEALRRIALLGPLSVTLTGLVIVLVTWGLGLPLLGTVSLLRGVS